MNTNTDTPTCEVCGRPATFRVGDIQELPATNGWRRCTSAGAHWYCTAHVRRPITYPIADSQAAQPIAPETPNV